MVVARGETTREPFIATPPNVAISTRSALATVQRRVDDAPLVMVVGVAVNADTTGNPEHVFVPVTVTVTDFSTKFSLPPQDATKVYMVVAVGATLRVPVVATSPTSVSSTSSAFVTLQLSVVEPPATTDAGAAVNDAMTGAPLHAVRSSGVTVRVGVIGAVACSGQLLPTHTRTGAERDSSPFEFAATATIV